MTLTQLQYLAAVAEHGSFMKAAESCYVTQPTLSMQIKKIEEYFNTQIFDRSKKPIVPTPVGKLIIEQAIIGISEVDKINRIVEFNNFQIPNKIRIGIIPTLCPYLIPLFLTTFSNNYPNLKIEIKEINTVAITKGLQEGQLDLGILIKPKKLPDNFFSKTIFHEPLLGYVSESHPLFSKNILTSEDIKEDGFWLLEDCHSLSNQVINFCENNHMLNNRFKRFDNRIGGLETARRLVELQGGFTVLPQLATLDFTEKQLLRIRKFNNPEPVREICLLWEKDFNYNQMNMAIESAIIKNLPTQIKNIDYQKLKVLSV